jgi:hypothetical protein
LPRPLADSPLSEGHPFHVQTAQVIFRLSHINASLPSYQSPCPYTTHTYLPPFMADGLLPISAPPGCHGRDPSVDKPVILVNKVV